MNAPVDPRLAVMDMPRRDARDNSREEETTTCWMEPVLDHPHSSRRWADNLIR